MSTAGIVARLLPCLRRYARAVTGSQKSADAYVTATLHALVADPAIVAGRPDARVVLYRAFSRIFNASGAGQRGACRTALASIAGHDAMRNADRHLAALDPRLRQVFLLLAVEDFTSADAARVLDLPGDEIAAMVELAGRDIARQMATNVVIIEDEPLIALDLQHLLRELGHQVSRIARTRNQAVSAVIKHRPGLVLADMRLADGSSGLDAVKEFVPDFDVPVIFLTGYPEQVLGADRPQPTFLVSKPFHAETLRAVISQALFFGTGGPAAAGRPTSGWRSFM